MKGLGDDVPNRTEERRGTRVVSEENIAEVTSRTVGPKFLVSNRLGGGSFGNVYRGVDICTGQPVAIKMEPLTSARPHLLFESRIYRALEGAVGVPRVHWYGVQGDNAIMVMDLLGPSLQDIFHHCGDQLPARSAAILGHQLVTRLECLHSHGYLHRDVKPQNFLLGATPIVRNMAFIVDFGLATRFRDPITGAHITEGNCANGPQGFLKQKAQSAHLVGTWRYCSVNTHQGGSASRRDDLESLVYTLVFLMRGSLPWYLPEMFRRRSFYTTSPRGGTPATGGCRRLAEGKDSATIPLEPQCANELGVASQGSVLATHPPASGGVSQMPNEIFLQILLMKRAVDCRTLCRGLPVEMAMMFEYCRKLSFSERPNYDYLRSLVGRIANVSGNHSLNNVDMGELRIASLSLFWNPAASDSLPVAGSNRNTSHWLWRSSAARAVEAGQKNDDDNRRETL